MCYMIFMSISVYVAPGAHGGLKGGVGEMPHEICFSLGNVSHFCLVFCVASIFMFINGWLFQHMVFFDGFLFSVKELGLLTNPGHWVRVLDVVRSYIILYCKQCITMNEYRICWFSQFGFPGENYLCNFCIFHCIFSVLLLKICL